MKGGTHTWFASSLHFHVPHPFPVPHRGSPEPYLLIMGISGQAACSAGTCQGMAQPWAQITMTTWRQPGVKSGVCLGRPVSVHHSAWLEAGSRQRGRDRSSTGWSKLKELGEVRQQVRAEGVGGSPRRGRKQREQCEKAAWLKVAGPTQLLLEPAGA